MCAGVSNYDFVDCVVEASDEIYSDYNIYNSLRIHEDNTKENHHRVEFIYLIKIHVPLYVKKKFSFFGLRTINFQTFFAN